MLKRQSGLRVGVLAFRRNNNLVVPMDEADRGRLSSADNAAYNRLGDQGTAHGILSAAILYRRYVLVDQPDVHDVQPDGSGGVWRDAGLHDRHRDGRRSKLGERCERWTLATDDRLTVSLPARDVIR